jgi:hypothetical protein
MKSGSYHMRISMRMFAVFYLLLILFSACKIVATGKSNPVIRKTYVDKGWARNSVNVAVFRKNSLVSFGDTQFIAFYNPDRFVVLGKRKRGEEKWIISKTGFRGNAADAHNVISIMVDGKGFLHIAWDHHNNSLHYSRAIAPGALEMTPEMPMTGSRESRLSYPEFYRLPDGDLLFFYRDGGSGNGNLVINRYACATHQWTTLHHNLIDGEGKRNAYWQAFVDHQGQIHISWVWRESPDVASNHDLCYARSTDGGKTWQKSTGERYQLPITATTAEQACSIPQGSELINQTSMCADEKGNPFIASYWRPEGTKVPQYHIVYRNSGTWKVQDLGFRKMAFSLSGAGTKRIPIARPQVLSWKKNNSIMIALVFRDEERSSRASIAMANMLAPEKWAIIDLDEQSLGSWEPTLDTELWKEKGLLHLFIQKVEQADSEGSTNIPPQAVEVWEWKPSY